MFEPYGRCHLCDGHVLPVLQIMHGFFHPYLCDVFSGIDPEEVLNFARQRTPAVMQVVSQFGSVVRGVGNMERHQPLQIIHPPDFFRRQQLAR